MNIQSAVIEGVNILKDKCILSAQLDTEILMAKALDKNREYIILNHDKVLDIENLEYFKKLVHERAAKKPIAYLLNKKFFWKNEFYVNKNVLIPRPETEHLIEETLSIIEKNQKKRLLEIGVGSGCLIISILKDRKNCSAIAIDCCQKAVKIAETNAKLHHIKNRIKILKTDVDNFNTGKYDLIISNPPYIDKHQLKYLGVSEYEPTKALDGGINGIEILSKVITKSSKLLKVNGKLIIEIGSNQKYKMIKILKNNNYYVNKIIKDLSNNDRCIVCTKLQ